jgi:hypothetical protein
VSDSIQEDLELILKATFAELIGVVAIAGTMPENAGGRVQAGRRLTAALCELPALVARYAAGASVERPQPGAISDAIVEDEERPDDARRAFVRWVKEG